MHEATTRPVTYTDLTNVKQKKREYHLRRPTRIFIAAESGGVSRSGSLSDSALVLLFFAFCGTSRIGVCELLRLSIAVGGSCELTIETWRIVGVIIGDVAKFVFHETCLELL